MTRPSRGSTGGARPGLRALRRAGRMTPVEAVEADPVLLPVPVPPPGRNEAFVVTYKKVQSAGFTACGRPDSAPHRARREGGRLPCSDVRLRARTRAAGRARPAEGSGSGIMGCGTARAASGIAAAGWWQG